MQLIRPYFNFLFFLWLFFIFFFTSQTAWAAPIGRLLVLGNSITWRTPNADLGWFGNWGMAASLQENDFSHVLASMIEKSQGQKLILYPRNVSDFERFPESFDFSRLNFVEYFRPDAVVIFLGDNVNADPKKISVFGKKYEHLLTTLVSGGVAKIYCVSTWWSNGKVDDLISKACLARGGKFVDIKGVSNLPGMRANSFERFSNPGVAAHPSDEGMGVIAEHIFNAVNGVAK